MLQQWARGVISLPSSDKEKKSSMQHRFGLDGLLNSLTVFLTLNLAPFPKSRSQNLVPQSTVQGTAPFDSSGYFAQGSDAVENL
ncbi:hypothetical protein VB005_00281 [Metarhizium brunneum]